MCMCLDSFLYSSSKIPTILQPSQLSPVYYWTPESYTPEALTSLQATFSATVAKCFSMAASTTISQILLSFSMAACSPLKCTTEPLYGSIHNHLPNVLLSLSMAASTTISQVYYWASLWQHPQSSQMYYWSLLESRNLISMIYNCTLSQCMQQPHLFKSFPSAALESNPGPPKLPHIPEQPPFLAGREVSNTTLNHITFWGQNLSSWDHLHTTVDQLTTYYIAYNACTQACIMTTKAPSHI